MSAEIEAIGPFQRRAARTISNAALFDLVEDLAKKVDRLTDIERKVDMILEKLDARSEI